MHIEGPAGRLEYQIEQATVNKRHITAVLCHPHPQYGGAMHDAVLQTSVEVLLGLGCSCVRFNFRGVGASTGSFDNGVGESHDLLAVSAWVAEEYPQDQLWWLGYSFGAAVVWQSLQSSSALMDGPQRAIFIAPPTAMMDFSIGTDPTYLKIGRLDAIAGDQDSFVDTQNLHN